MDFFPSFGLKSLAVILKLKKEFSDSLLSPFLYSINLDIYKARRLSDVRKNRIIDIHL